MPDQVSAKFSQPRVSRAEQLTAILRLLQAQGRAQTEQWQPDLLSVLVSFIRFLASSAEWEGQLPYSWDNSSFLITDYRPGCQLPVEWEQGVVKGSLSCIFDPSRNEPLDSNEVLADAHGLSDDDLFRDFMWAIPVTGKLSPFTTVGGYMEYTRVGVQPARSSVLLMPGASSMPIILRPVGNRHGAYLLAARRN